MVLENSVKVVLWKLVESLKRIDPECVEINKVSLSVRIFDLNNYFLLTNELLTKQEENFMINNITYQEFNIKDKKYMSIHVGQTT